jgi:hypothetical protein
MPVIFIHGVNVRKSGNYDKEVAARAALLRRLVLQPLARTKPALANMNIADPYWGGDGVSFRWRQASLPKVQVLESLGAEAGTKTGGTYQSDLDLASTVLALAGTPPPSKLEPLGASDQAFRSAALKDPVRFIEAVLSPVILAEMPVASTDSSSQDAGLQEALLMIAADDVGQDHKVLQAIRAAASNQDVIAVLKQATLARFETLMRENGQVPQAPAASGVLEPLGQVQDFFSKVKDRAGEVFDRAVGAPGRAGTVAMLAGTRGGINSGATQFLGDVFVYLIERDLASPGKPYGPIVATVLDAIQNTPRASAHEPLIVITHSMGGNILYDVITHYQPALVIDAWISVACQAGEFEEMKLFKNSNKALQAPDQVRGLRNRIKYWLNVYDPADILSFLGRPVFEDVNEDLEYHTGASAFKAHSAYFLRPSFYHAVRDRLEKVLP